ncbi:MAG: response regulator [Gemmatimonadales bacterium]|nr:response regulator [Gemmatimonadales bacterium]
MAERGAGRLPPAPAPDPSGGDPRAHLRGTETVLLVDDEPSVRRTGSRILARFGYEVLVAQDGVEALEVLESPAGAAVALVVTDMVMPRMDARDLITRLRQRWPTLPVLLSTGYDMGRLAPGELQLFSRLVPKPYTPEEILTAVRQTLDERRR